jgi:outer membrane protein OmpA-like peptidoglycan-associated protein
MRNDRIFALTLIALATLAGCSTLPADNIILAQARSNYAAAQNNPQTRDLAGAELKQAGDSLAVANAASLRGAPAGEVDHLAYLARQRVAIAEETGNQKAAERTVSNADAARDKVRLAARTNEADRAQQSARVAQAQAADAQTRNRQLEAQISELKAKKTDRGLVITLGDVLFDSDKAKLRASGTRSVGKLAAFLRDYPQRRVLIEGFTDSTGSESHNQELSAERAAAVRSALVDQGVGSERIATQAYGEAYPVAGNDSAGARQMNRRVEIVVSEDGGAIPAR